MDSMSGHRDAQDVCAVSFLAHILLSSIYLNSNVGIRKAKFDENFNTTERGNVSFCSVDVPWLVYFII